MSAAFFPLPCSVFGYSPIYTAKDYLMEDSVCERVGAHNLTSGSRVKMRPLNVSDTLYGGGKSSFIHEGRFLTIVEVVEALEQCQEGGPPDMLQKFIKAHREIPVMLNLYQALSTNPFPVVQLRHVTVAEYFLTILKTEKIIGSDRTFLLKGVERSLRVSCWGVHIPPRTLDDFREQRLEQFRQRATDRGLIWNLSYKENTEVRDMLANSPAMREESRYGNFQFSFSTKDLLAMYQDQQCGGQKPVLRELGTEAYKQELVHWILIHHPDFRDFDHLPTMDPPGPILWCPESITNEFTWQVDPSNRYLEKKGITYSQKNEPIQKYDAWMWNNAVFAFYLPDNNALKIDRRRLLDNVQGCETAEGILRHPKKLYTSKSDAEFLIETEKRK